MGFGYVVQSSGRTELCVLATALAWCNVTAMLAQSPSTPLDKSTLISGWRTIEPSQPDGVVTLAGWKHDWPGCAWEDGISEGRVSVVTDGSDRWWRVKHLAGQIGPSAGGAGWRYRFSNAAERTVQMKFRVLFEEGYDFKKSGKLAGLCGGPRSITGGAVCTGYEGWSARIVWRSGRRGLAYVYHPNQRGKYGDEFPFTDGFQFPIGKPTGLRLEVKINTIGQRDGHIKVWAQLPDDTDTLQADKLQAEQLVVDRPNMEWTKVETIGVDSMIFNAFHGGGDSSFAPGADSYDRFGGFGIRVMQQ